MQRGLFPTTRPVLWLHMCMSRAALIGFIVCSLLSSCARPEVHLHDRHSLSYPLVESYAKKHPGATLVLFDYHHDVGPAYATVSSNWVGKLLADGTVSRVLWVSGRDLLLPNRNARTAWLRRKLSKLPPAEADRIGSRITLIDWDRLRMEKIAGPLAVSVDFDLFCHDPGNPPDRFVDEIAEWTARQRPALLTLALSSAYQKEAKAPWEYLGRFVGAYGKSAPGAGWFLETGPSNPDAEGAEESSAWRLWDAERETFGRRNESFLPGSAVWLAPPLSLRAALLGLAVSPGDDGAKGVLSAWRGQDPALLEKEYPQESTDRILAAAAVSLEAFWRGEAGTLPGSGTANLGLAVRLQSDGGDRGCFAVYRGLSDPDSAAAYCVRLAAKDPRYPAVLPSEKDSIDIELSVFGAWREMKDAYDFIPGVDSLLLTEGKNTTLLQAPVAAERGYGREEFLARLSNKAGLGTDGWKKSGLRFSRAATIWSRRSLASIEASELYQKNVKK